MKKIIEKFLNREVISYIICGACTTLVNMIVYAICCKLMDVLIANVIAWIISVLFAFIVNKIFVFQSKTNTQNDVLKEIIGFFGGRVGTLLIESGILFLFVKVLFLNEMIIKIIAQFVVLVLNYLISKFVVFKKK